MRLTPTIFIFIILHSAFLAISQDRPIKTVDIKRIKLHEDIDQLQQSISRQFNLPITEHISQSEDLFWHKRAVDSMQAVFEYDTVLTHRLKVKYLTGLIILMQEYQKIMLQKPLLYEAGINFLNFISTIQTAHYSGSSGF